MFQLRHVLIYVATLFVPPTFLYVYALQQFPATFSAVHTISTDVGGVEKTVLAINYIWVGGLLSALGVAVELEVTRFLNAWSLLSPCNAWLIVHCVPIVSALVLTAASLVPPVRDALGPTFDSKQLEAVLASVNFSNIGIAFAIELWTVHTRRRDQLPRRAPSNELLVYTRLVFGFLLMGWLTSIKGIPNWLFTAISYFLASPTVLAMRSDRFECGLLYVLSIVMFVAFFLTNSETQLPFTKVLLEMCGMTCFVGALAIGMRL